MDSRTRKSAKTSVPASSKVSPTAVKPLHPAGQVLAYLEEGVTKLAVTLAPVSKKGKKIDMKGLLETGKAGKYAEGDEISVSTKAVLGPVQSKKTGKTYTIAQKDIPQTDAEEIKEEETPVVKEKAKKKAVAEKKPEKKAAPAKASHKAKTTEKKAARSRSAKPAASKSHKKKTVSMQPKPAESEGNEEEEEERKETEEEAPEIEEEKVPKEEKPVPKTRTSTRATKAKPTYKEPSSSSDTESDEEEAPKKRKAKKPAKAEVSDFEESDSGSEPAARKGKAGKGKAGKGKKTKLCAVAEISQNEELESLDKDPNTHCCLSCNDRNVLRAAITSNEQLWDVILHSKKEFSSLEMILGPEVKRTALEIAVEQGNGQLIRSIVSEFVERKMDLGYRTEAGLALVGTGHVSREAFGVQVRQVNVARGGREGNNALLNEMYSTAGLQGIGVKLVRRGVSTDILDLLFTVYPQYDTLLSDSVGDAVRTGDLPLALHMVQIYNKKGGFGFNFLHEAVLKKAKLPEFKKVSVTKKVIGNHCIAPLHCACVNPDASHLRELLALTDNINYEDFDKWRAVHYAAVCVSAEPMKALCEHGVNINDITKEKVTPLMLAAKRNRAVVAEFLLKKGANIDAKSKKGKAAMHYAAQYGGLEVLQVLLRYMSNKTLDLPGPNKMTPLIVASMKGHLSIVKELLDHGAGVKKRDKLHRSALLLSIKNGHADVASVLLAFGADPNDPDSSKNAPLHYACGYGWWQCTNLLLDCQANINAPNDWKLPPLLVALLKGHYGLMKRLLEVSDVDVNCKDEDGRTLLSRSVDMLSPATLEHMEDLLQHRHADPNIADLNGLTPLHHLASRRKPVFPGTQETAKEEQDAYIEEQWTLQERAGELLLNYGANLNAETNEKQTPILLSLESRNSRICRFLLNKGAEIQMQSATGSNILHATAALDSELFPIVHELLQIPEIREKINAVNDDGFTPLLSFCHVYATEAQGAYQTINARIRAEMLEEAKKHPLDKTGNAFAAMLNSTGAPITKEEEEEEHSEDSAGGLFGGARTRQTARRVLNAGFNFNQRQTDATYLIDEAELKRKTDAAFQALLDQFSDLLQELVHSGSDPFSHVEKLKKYRDDPQVIRIEYEETKSKEEVLKAQQTLYFGQPQSAQTFFIPDYDGSQRWNEYGPDGLKTPLHFLLAYSNEQLLASVLKLRLDLNQRDFHGETALHQAVVIPQSLKTVAALLDAGTDPNVKNCKGQTPLHHACGTKNAELVGLLISRKANAEILDTEGTFPLKIAVVSKDSSTVRVLLDKGADPNFCDGKKRTALHHAFNSAEVSADASFEIESLLLEFGGDINLKDVRDRTPLHYAFVKIGDPDLNTAIDPVETVSSACGMKGVNTNVKDVWGRTPLHYSAQRGSVTSAMIMIEAGADVNLQDTPGNTPLGIALASGHPEFATMMLQHRPDISLPVIVGKKIKEKQGHLGGGLFQQAYDPNDYSYNVFGQRRGTQGTQEAGGPLQVGTYSTFRAAVKQNWLGVAYLLLYRGYDYMRAMQDAMNEQKFQLCLTLLAKVTDGSIVRKSNEDNQNLFHTLATHGVAADLQVTNALGTKLHIRKVDHSQKDVSGRQPLHIACSSQYPALISFLLNLNADPNALDLSLKTPLVLAIEFKRVLTSLPTLQSLTKANFNVRFRNEEGLEVTPIIHAVMQAAAKEVVLFMLNAGADITATDGKGRNLLVHAIRKNNFPLVEAILGFKGLDLTCKDAQGWTYAHHAVSSLDLGSYENESILRKLAESGVSLTETDTDGHSPYYYACKQHSGTMKLALETLGVTEEPVKPDLEMVFAPQMTVDFLSDYEEFIKAKAEDMEIVDLPAPDPVGEFPAYYEVVKDFDLLMVRVDLAYGPFSAYLFYRMQLLRDRNRDVFVLFTRWGRIGETGAYQRTPFSTLEEGEAEFKKVFKEKTKNEFGTDFHHVKGKYRLLPLRKKHVEHKQFLQLFDFVKAPPAQLGPELQGVLKQLTDTNVYATVFSGSQINLDVLNFSNIGKSDLSQAEELLCEISDVIKQIQHGKNHEVILDLKERLYDLNSRLYEIIPVVDFQHSAVAPVQNEYELKQKMDMLETLRYVEVASKIILGALYRQDQMNPYDYCYFSLHMEMTPLLFASPEYQLLRLYAENGGNTKPIINIFRIQRAEEVDRIQKHAGIKHRMLLWHGSVITNLMGIFTQGLKIAPPEAPATGYMFGKGIYFADSFSKSAQYCGNAFGTGTTKTSVFILLAEVVLGKTLEKYAGENIEKLPHGYQSVSARGMVGPDFAQNVVLANGVSVPCGAHISYPQPTEPNTYFSLQQNEYIVYHVNQVRLRYLVELKQ